MLIVAGLICFVDLTVAARSLLVHARPARQPPLAPLAHVRALVLAPAQTQASKVKTMTKMTRLTRASLGRRLAAMVKTRTPRVKTRMPRARRLKRKRMPKARRLTPMVNWRMTSRLKLPPRLPCS